MFSLSRLNKKTKIVGSIFVLSFVVVYVSYGFYMSHSIKTELDGDKAPITENQGVETVQLDTDSYDLLDGLNYVTKVSPDTTLNKRLFEVKIINASKNEQVLTFKDGIRFEYFIKDMTDVVRATGYYDVSDSKEVVGFESTEVAEYVIDLTKVFAKLDDGSYMVEFRTDAVEVEKALYGLSVTKDTDAESSAIVNSKVEFVRVNKDSTVQLKVNEVEDTWSYNNALAGFFKRQEEGANLIIGHTQGDTKQVVTAKVN